MGNSINPHTQKRKAVFRAIIPRTIDLYSVQERPVEICEHCDAIVMRIALDAGVARCGGASPLGIFPRKI